MNKAFTAANGEIGSPDGIEPVGAVTPPPPSGTIVVSEVSPWGSGNAPYAADWFELTNTGSTDVNLTGWTMDDNSNSPANAVALTGVTTLPAGKSAIFMEDTGADGSAPDPSLDATARAAFAQAWFSLNALPSGFLFGFYGGKGVGLSTGGDAVNIFDASGDRVTGVAFGASPSSAPFPSFDNSAGAGSTTLPLPVLSTLSAVGTNGAFLSADGQEIGSPGSLTAVTPPPPPAPSVVISEVSPWASGNTPYAADWFELTNTGYDGVDLTGWKMDDNSELLRQRGRADWRQHVSGRASRRSSWKTPAPTATTRTRRSTPPRRPASRRPGSAPARCRRACCSASTAARASGSVHRR